MSGQVRSSHTFEPLKANLSPEVFKLALEGRRLAEADARIQQARQETASRTAAEASGPASGLPVGSDLAETPCSTQALTSKPAFSKAGFASQAAEVRPLMDEDRLQPKLEPPLLRNQAHHSEAQTSARQPAEQTPARKEQVHSADQRAVLQKLQHELLLKQAARSNEIQALCNELRQLEATRDGLINQQSQVLFKPPPLCGQ